jgi:hypothetical protein
MKKLLLPFLYLFLGLQAYSQHELSAFTATGRGGVGVSMLSDYQCVGINPANISLQGRFKEKKMALGFMELGVSAHSRALSRSELNNSITTFNGDDFTVEQKLKAAAQFANAPLALNVDVGLVGFSINLPKVGGFAFAVRERMQWYSEFNPQSSNLLFSGYYSSYFDSLRLRDGRTITNRDNLPDSILDLVNRGVKGANPLTLGSIIDGSRVNFSWTREYNVSYSNKLVSTDRVALYAGLGVKYIQGYAGIDIAGSSSGGDQGFVSLSPVFDVDFGEAQRNNPNALSGTGLEATGTGLGMDLGLTLEIEDNWRISASLVNVGSMTWQYNLYSLQNARVESMTTSGFDNYNIFIQAQQLTGDGGLFTWKAEESRTTRLPSIVRVGGSYRLGELLEIGADLVMPTNDVVGSFAAPIYATGADLYVLPWLRLSSGAVYGGNSGARLQIPLGVTFIGGDQGSYEAGIASRDAISYFLNENTTVSLATGFLRFRF